MKRPLAFVGFSMAITLLLLNIIDYIYAKYVLVLAVVLFTVSLLITKLRQARVVPLVCGATLLACLIFILGYANVNNQQMLDGCQARTKSIAVRFLILNYTYNIFIIIRIYFFCRNKALALYFAVHFPHQYTLFLPYINMYRLLPQHHPQL